MSRSLLKRSCMVFLFSFMACQGFAQTFALPDTNLRNAFLKKHPYLMTGNELNLAAANAYNGGLDLDSANIVDATGIEFFTNNRTINLSTNKLTSIPQIANLTLLENLFVIDNQLTALPSLSNLINLRELQVQDNELTALPSFAGLTNLRRLYIYNNKITMLPASLTSLANLEILVASGNTFTSALNVTSLTGLKQLHINETGVDTLIGLSSLTNLEQLHCWGNKLRSISGLNSGNKLIFLLASDNPLKTLPNLAPFTNLRQLHVNNTQIDTIRGLASLTLLNELHCSGNSIRNLSSLNGLTYLNTLIAKDNLLQQLPTLSNKPFLFAVNVKRNLLTFEDFLPLTSLSSFNSISYDPQLQFGTETTYTIRKKEAFTLDANIDPSVTTSWYKWYKNGTVLDSNQTGTFTIESVDFADQGIYSVTVTNAAVPGLILSSCNWTLKVTNCEGCAAVFSPDGDGLLDTYKIDESGIARIYNTTGNLVKELHVPGEWDGTNLNGILNDAGYYAIVINGKKVINVSLMR